MTWLHFCLRYGLVPSEQRLEKFRRLPTVFLCSNCGRASLAPLRIFSRVEVLRKLHDEDIWLNTRDMCNYANQDREIRKFEDRQGCYVARKKASLM